MIDVAKALAPPPEWTDTPELAQVRACIIAALDQPDADPVETLKLAARMITMLRDQVLTGVGTVRREAAHTAKSGGMSAADLAKASGQTRPTVSRLLSEYRAYAE